MNFNKGIQSFFILIGVIATMISIGAIFSMVFTEDSAESEQVTSAPVQTVPRPTIPPDRRLTPTPVPTTPIGTFLVQYSVKTKERLAVYNGYEYPKPGMIFLIFELKITNDGWKSVTSNNFMWDLSASTKDNPATFIRMEQVFSGESEGIICESAEIGYGGTSSCKVAYQVPVNYDQYKLKYSTLYNFNERYENIGN